ncbi:MAG TPA: Gfo/Idh/MocA family oxidoreductase [Clostridiales bacterium]|jgi:predicted dehydrogenase|nr:Gfo/Idh/MocA family oxidoreductase [Clostridiales bacterium]
MARKIKTGVFGGGRGRSMISALLRNPDAELVAVCDKYVPLLDSVKAEADKFGVKVELFDNFDDFIKCDMDAVVLANYATEHGIYALKCFEKGKHVMSEVLPTETMGQLVELIEAVEESGLVYAYAENYCYMDKTFEIWRRYQNGDIGEVNYAECHYIHDCASCWLDITYGEKDHWRNRLIPTFYCTHSLGPIIMATGRRPVQVVGFENPPIEEFYHLGHPGGHASGIEMVTLDNGAVVKSLHGALKRGAEGVFYSIYGERGCLEALGDGKVRCYIENPDWSGNNEIYVPEKFVSPDIAARSGMSGHGGSDFYPTYFFIEKILGREDGKWSIDVHQAAMMSMCGLLAYRSILDGSKPWAVPDLRDKKERDKWRNDHHCTNPAVAGDQLLPTSKYGDRDIPDSVYEGLRKQWLEKQGK